MHLFFGMKQKLSFHLLHPIRRTHWMQNRSRKGLKSKLPVIGPVITSQLALTNGMRSHSQPINRVLVTMGWTMTGKLCVGNLAWGVPG